MESSYSINKLYRYRKVDENAIQALRQGRLYFSTPQHFNDPFDSVSFIDNQKLFSNICGDLETGIQQGYFQKRLADMGKNPDDFIKTIRDPSARAAYFATVHIIIDYLRELLVENAKVICFSSLTSSVLMWSHYADYHKGFLLEYDSYSLKNAPMFDTSDHELCRDIYLDKVSYVEELPDCGVDYYDSLPDHLQNIKKVWTERFCRKHLFNKMIEWNYENEWRLWAINKDYRSADEAAYIKVKPSAVILGVRTSPEDEQRICDAIAGQNIAVYKMERDIQSPSFLLQMKEYSREKRRVL